MQQTDKGTQIFSDPALIAEIDKFGRLKQFLDGLVRNGDIWYNLNGIGGLKKKGGGKWVFFIVL